jgi:hypothetical protein
MYSIDFFFYTRHFLLDAWQERIRKPHCQGNPGVYPWRNNIKSLPTIPLKGLHVLVFIWYILWTQNEGHHSFIPGYFTLYWPNDRLTTTVYAKRDDFNFAITNIPLHCSNTPPHLLMVTCLSPSWFDTQEHVCVFKARPTFDKKLML